MGNYEVMTDIIKIACERSPSATASNNNANNNDANNAGFVVGDRVGSEIAAISLSLDENIQRVWAERDGKLL